jgi:hypothetical protein
MKEYTFEQHKQELFAEIPQLKEMYEQELLNHFI